MTRIDPGRAEQRWLISREAVRTVCHIHFIQQVS
jgi:hypothetical protein